MRSPMNRAAILLAMSVAACSSGGSSIVKPEIQMIQLYAPADIGYARGQNTSMAEFGFQILNRAAEPITLRRIQIETVGDGGYYLRREDRSYTRTIGSGETVAETIQARAYFRTTGSGTASTEPVLLRATLYFEAPSGPFRQIVLRNIGQFSQGPR